MSTKKHKDSPHLGTGKGPRKHSLWDTLWGIAKRYYPGEHTGQRVFEIRQLNPGLDPGRLIEMAKEAMGSSPYPAASLGVVEDDTASGGGGQA